MRELVDGPEGELAFITNVGDRGFIRSLALLSGRGEFARSRYLLEARYQHPNGSSWSRASAGASRMSESIPTAERTPWPAALAHERSRWATT